MDDYDYHLALTIYDVHCDGRVERDRIDQGR